MRFVWLWFRLLRHTRAAFQAHGSISHLNEKPCEHTVIIPKQYLIIPHSQTILHLCIKWIPIRIMTYQMALVILQLSLSLGLARAHKAKPVILLLSLLPCHKTLHQHPDDETQRPYPDHNVRPPTQLSDTTVKYLHLHVTVDEQIFNEVIQRRRHDCRRDDTRRKNVHTMSPPHCHKCLHESEQRNNDARKSDWVQRQKCCVDEKKYESQCKSRKQPGDKVATI